MATKKTVSQTIMTDSHIVEVLTTVRTHARTIDFSDIVQSVEVDECHTDAPWEDCDGYEHDIEWLRRRSDDTCEYRAMQGYGYSDANRDSFVVTISDDVVRNWGFSDTEFYPGASRQVSRELFAQVKRVNLARIVSWYANGWEYYLASAEHEDSGFTDSVGGILQDSGDKYADECALECARNVASELQDAGYIVENIPELKMQTSADRMRANIRRHLDYYTAFSK